MKTIIFSDVHGNLEALQAALKFIEMYPNANIYSLGDIIGYGANPKECISEIRRITHVSLAGNHDHAAIGLTDIEYFNPYAKNALLWTMNCLEKEDRDYLFGLSLSKEFSKKILLVHSSPLYPEQWDYILNVYDAQKNFSGFDEPICFVGHSHSPMVIELSHKGTISLDKREMIHIKPKNRYIINVGSVGQPRDGDWRACLVIYDEDAQTIEFKRLEYDLSTAQEKILQAGLPIFLSERLQYGR